MAKKLMSVAVKGKNSWWGFNFYGDPKHLKEWRADGLEVVEIENIVPAWVVDCDLVHVWCCLQDVWNFRNPFKKKDDTHSFYDGKD